MFIKQGFIKNNNFLLYIIGSLLAIIISTIGQVPFMIALFYKTVVLDKKSFPSDQHVMMKILDSNLTLFLLTFSFAFGLFGLYFIVKYLHKQTILSLTTSRPKVDWNRIFFAFGIWTMFTIISALVFYFLEPELFVYNFKPVPFLILFIVATIMIPLQTSCEEFIFRAYLMQGFALLSRNKWFPLMMTSLIFGGMHILNPEVEKLGYSIMIYYIGTGLFLGILTLMDEGLELSLGFHAANNLVGALIVTSDWGVFQTNSILIDKSQPELFSSILLPVLVVYPVLLFIFSRKYGWSNWKDKLAGNIETDNEISINKLGENE